MLLNMVLIVTKGLVQGPTFKALKANFICQLLEHILGSVTRMNIQGFGSSIQEKKPKNERSV